MKNDLFTIGSITIHGYGLMIGIGIIVAYYLAEYRANKRGMDVDMISRSRSAVLYVEFRCKTSVLCHNL